MKKLLAVLLAAIMVLGMAACGDTAETTTAAPDTQATDDTTKAADDTTAEAAQYTTKIVAPAVITTIGQADIDVGKQVLKKAGVEFTEDDKLAADAVGNYGTIFMVIGASKKGLGAAGISVEDEVARANAVIDAAKAAGKQIIAMHLGGEDRRGGQSDQIIDAVIVKADFVVVAGTGNADGHFTQILSGTGIPITVVDNTKAAVDVIAALL